MNGAGFRLKLPIDSQSHRDESHVACRSIKDAGLTALLGNLAMDASGVAFVVVDRRR